MEFLAYREVLDKKEALSTFFIELMRNKLLVGKPDAVQWRFFRACIDLLLNARTDSGFLMISKAQAAQLKFEVDNKLRWFLLQPGAKMKFVPFLLHASKLGLYGYSPKGGYPELAGYCLLIRENPDLFVFGAEKDRANLRSYLERVVTESIDAEFRAYAMLPSIQQEELDRWFHPDGTAIKEILSILRRHRERGWVISNPLNPSTKRLLRIKVQGAGPEECTVHTTEYWYLRWWDKMGQKWVYPYRETNTQRYVLRRHESSWKVYENLRPSPRTSAPFRRFNIKTTKE